MTQQLSQMKHVKCYKCSVGFQMELQTYNYYHSTGETFYCPNGHPQYFSDTVSESAREIKELKVRMVILDNIITNQGKTIRKLYDEIYYLRRSQCPECDKWYVNLDSHIKKQHSDEG